jgi:NAD(P)-dependent dehydrogenase (short-subunit alcohol dehydrogenase family)
VVVERLDLASLRSVRECAQKLLDKEDKIDILINNAGIKVMPVWYKLTFHIEWLKQRFKISKVVQVLLIN